MRFSVIKFVFFLFLFFGVSGVLAQTQDELAQQAASTLNLDEYSAPSVEILVSASGAIGTTATLSAVTENINDNFAEFSWYLDDQPAPAQTGRGRTLFSFQTARPAHTVRLVVSQNGTLITENMVSVRSLTVDLAWHANTLVPPSYQGKALPSVGSRVVVIALPEFPGEDPKNLLYTWYLDAESRIRGVAGEEEFSFAITKNVPSVSVIVEVSNAAQSLSARHAITVPVARPTVTLSPAGPLLAAGGAKMTVRAFPFYFRATNAGELSYTWNFGAQTAVGVPPDPSVLELAVPNEPARGGQTLRLTVENHSVVGERAFAETTLSIL